jgi:formylmethanofuran:tetrahydromethanopterin formyltransferase
MTDSKTLLQRIATAISTAPQGETYEDCRNNEAKAVLEETVKFMREIYYKRVNYNGDMWHSLYGSINTIPDMMDILKEEANK